MPSHSGPAVFIIPDNLCYFRERACGTDRQWIAWVGVVEWWAGDGSVTVCVCVSTLNIEQSLLCDRAETCSDVFSFPWGSFHILPFLATNQTGCSSHSQSAWQMGSRVEKKAVLYFILFRFDFDMQQNSSVSLTPDFLFDFSSEQIPVI